jgi:hypothetical protein
MFQNSSLPTGLCLLLSGIRHLASDARWNPCIDPFVYGVAGATSAHRKAITRLKVVGEVP